MRLLDRGCIGIFEVSPDQAPPWENKLNLSHGGQIRGKPKAHKLILKDLQMKILIPILGFAPQGGYRVLSKLANSWLGMGHSVSFLIPETSLDPYFPTSAQIVSCNRKGVITNTLSTVKTTRKTTGFDNIISLYAGLKQIGSKFDVILANHSMTAWPVKFANCGYAKKAYYIQAYEPDYFKILNSPIKYVLAKMSYQLGLRQILNSPTYPIEPNSTSVNFVPPGIDIENFYPRLNAPVFRVGGKVTLGTIGRLEPHKGTKFILEAFEQLYLDNPQVILKVAFGNLPQGWHHEAVEVVNIQNDIELANFYRSIDILLVGCFGQVGAPHYPLIEALACGTPVVQSGYFPGNRENSWVIPQGDQSALVTTITEMIQQNDVIEKTIKGVEFVQKNLEWEVVAKSMLAYLCRES